MTWRSRVRPELAALSAYHVPPLACPVKLDANESPYPPSPAFAAALGEALAHAPLHRYSDPRAGHLRTLCARELGQPEDRLLFGNGSDELIGLLCQTFAAPSDGRGAQPGAVAYPGPTFVVYRTAAVAAGLTVCEAPLGPRFEADPDALTEVIDRVHPNLVFVATPNNPTGTRWPRAALERLVFEHPDTVVVIDEAYAVYGGESHLDLVERAENCLVMRTYSKVGLAGLRLGVLVGQQAILSEVEKVRPPYNLGLLPQLAGELALGPFADELSAHVAEVVREREHLAEALRALPGVEAFPSSANLILLRVAEAQRVWRHLVEQGVLVRNLDRPGPLSGCLRVTVGTPEENHRFLAALTDALTAHRE